MSRVAYLILILALSGLALPGCDSKESTPEKPAFAAPEGLKKGTTPFPNVITSGQPTLQQFGELADSGVTTVINLRTAGEVSFDEKAEVLKHGMTYVSIPVRGKSGLTKENAVAFDAALKQAGDQKILVHCGSSLRVGALYALRAGLVQGKSTDEAISIGQETGLGSLEPDVREVLETHAK